MMRSAEAKVEKKYDATPPAAADQTANTLFELGQRYEDGIEGVTKDEKKAVEYYTAAANLNFAPAQHNLGWCYMDGKGIDKDEKIGFELITKAAVQGHRISQNNLIYFYYEGKGVEKSQEKTVEWSIKTSNQGCAISQFYLGRCYLWGDGVAKDEKLAVQWITKSAAQGNAEAQSYLAALFSRRVPIEQRRVCFFKPEHAMELWKKAAAKNHQDAQNELAAFIEDSLATSGPKV